MKTIPDNTTIREAYEPAMKITATREADVYFEALVQSCMTHGKSRKRAEYIERSNLAYYAGYYDNDTRERVERLFNCAHPVFGPIAKYGAPTPEDAFEAGRKMAKSKLKK